MGLLHLRERHKDVDQDAAEAAIMLAWMSEVVASIDRAWEQRLSPEVAMAQLADLADQGELAELS